MNFINLFKKLKLETMLKYKHMSSKINKCLNRDNCTISSYFLSLIPIFIEEWLTIS